MPDTNTITQTGSEKSAPAGKYLTFVLRQESYGIEVLKVREIIRGTMITAVPQLPAYCRGVINLRGKIIPVMDLRMRFNFDTATDSSTVCIVVVQAQFQTGAPHLMGLVVDGVEEVVTLGAGDIEHTPDFGGQIRADFVTGLAKVKGHVKVLLDIDKVIGTGTWNNWKQLAAK